MTERPARADRHVRTVHAAAAERVRPHAQPHRRERRRARVAKGDRLRARQRETARVVGEIEGVARLVGRARRDGRGPLVRLAGVLRRANGRRAARRERHRRDGGEDDRPGPHAATLCAAAAARHSIRPDARGTRHRRLPERLHAGRRARRPARGTRWPSASNALAALRRLRPRRRDPRLASARPRLVRGAGRDLARALRRRARPGAALHAALDAGRVDVVVDKGQDPGTEGYSGFEATVSTRCCATAGRPRHRRRPRHGLLRPRTALDALREGFGVTLDSTAGSRAWRRAGRRRPRARRRPRRRRSGALMAVDTSILAFVRGALPPPPARVLEVGAGRGELAGRPARGGLRRRRDRPGGRRRARRRARRAARRRGRRRRLRRRRSPSSRCTTSSRSPESCAPAREVVRPGGVLVIDEFDVGRFDDRAAAWQIAQRTAAGCDPDHDAAGSHDLRHHMHPVADDPRGARVRVRPRRAGARPVPVPLGPRPGAAAGRGASRSPTASLPATGARMVGVRR